MSTPVQFTAEFDEFTVSQELNQYNTETRALIKAGGLATE